MLLDSIPGLAEAVRAGEEQDAAPRLLPFLGIDLEICGVAVKQFCPLHFLYLDVARSPFIHGGEVGPEHVAQFLWIVSTDFAPGDAVCRDVFLAEIVDVPFEAALEAIHQYLDEAYADRPRGGRADSSPATYYLPALVDQFVAAGYPWSEEVILRMPFTKIFQYLRRIRLRKEPDACFPAGAADRAKREAVNAYLASQAGQTKEEK